MGINFTDVTLASGITTNNSSTFGVAWGDYNNDGLPDLFIGNHGARFNLYENQGDGTFQDVTLAVFPDRTPRDAHGTAWADFDNDGDQDLIQLTGGQSGQGGVPNQFYVNENGLLVERAAEIGGIDYENGRGRTPLWLDYDNDGQLDFIHLGPPLRDSVEGTSAIFNNTCCCPMCSARAGDVFVNLSSELDFDLPAGNEFGVLSDLNGDGQMEIILENITTNGRPVTIYDTTSDPFQDVTLELLPHLQSGDFSSLDGLKDAVAADFNGDLLPDLYITRHGQDSDLYQEGQRLNLRLASTASQTGRGASFVTAGDITFNFYSGPDFSNILIGSGGFNPTSSTFTLSPSDPAVQGLPPFDPSVDKGKTVIGYDAATQTWQIIQSTPGSPQSLFSIESTDTISQAIAIGFDPNASEDDSLFLNNSQALVDSTAGSGLNSIPVAGESVVAGDFDNDMDLDLYIQTTGMAGNRQNILYENQGNGTFVAVTDLGDALGTTLGIGDSVTSVDYDGDGFLDLFLANGGGFFRDIREGPYQLLRNPGNSNHWIQIDLEGVVSNRDAVGAKVIVTAGGVSQLREQTGGVHKFVQNHQRLHFGLGQNTLIDEIKIWWPSGLVQTITNVSANQILRIQEDLSLNAQPVISVNNGLTVDEGTTVAITSNDLQVTDTNNTSDELTYRLSSVPTNGSLNLDGLSLSIGSSFTQADIDAGRLSYQHNGNESTDDTFVFTVTDGLRGEIGETTFNLAISPVNDAPTVGTPIPNQIFQEDTPFSYSFPTETFADVDVDDSLSYFANLADGSPLPTWLNFDSTSRTFSGITPADFETLLVRVTAQDSAGEQASVDFLIFPPSDPPVVTINNGLTVDEGTVAVVTGGDLQVTDSDNTSSELTYTLSSVPTNGNLRLDGVSLNVGSTFTQADIDAGQLSYQHDGSETTVDTLTFTIADGAGNELGETLFNFAINPTNDAPTPGTSIPDQTIQEGISFSFSFPIETFVDVDAGDVLSYSAELADGSALPDWLNFDGTSRTFSGNTPAGFESFSIRVTAQDSAGSQVSDVFEIVPSSPIPPGLLLGLNRNTVLGGVSFTVQDIVYFDGTTFSLFFDGSDVGLSSAAINAFDAISRTEVLISFSDPITLPGVGAVDDSDVVLFTATSLGETTSGRFSLYFDGSDVGLTTDDEAIDGLALLPNGSLLISTEGNFSPGSSILAADEDISQFVATSLGDNTAGSFSLLIDGSDLGFASTDIDAFSVDRAGNFAFSTAHNVTTQGIDIGNEDVIGFIPTSTGVNTSGSFIPELIFNGSDFGYSQNIRGVDLFEIDLVMQSNELPLVAVNNGLTLDEGATVSITSNDLQVTDTDNTSDELLYTLSNLPTNGGLSLNGVSLSVGSTFTQADIDADRLSYQHDGSETLTDTFAFTVADGAGGEIGETSFDFSINPVNDVPTVANPIPDQTVQKATPFDYSFPAETFADADVGDSLSYSAVLADGSALPDWLSFDAASRTFSGIVPVGLESLSVQVIAQDIAGEQVSDVFDIFPAGAVPAIAINNGLNLDEGTSAPITSGDLQATDADNTSDELTYRLNSLPTNGSLNLDGVSLGVDSTFTQADIDNGRLSYQHSGDETTEDAFTFTVTDGAGGEIGETNFAFSINPVNDAPTVSTPIPDQIIQEEASFSYSFPIATFADADVGDSLSYSAALADGSALPGWLSFDAASRTFSGVAPAGAAALSVQVTAQDSAGEQVSDIFEITPTSATPPGLLLSLNRNTTLSGISFTTQDIVYFDGSSYSLYFDGSDVGLSSAAINAFDTISGTEILFTFAAPMTLPDIGLVDVSDVVLFTASSLGETTVGTFSLYFDGSDVGLSGSDAAIDALLGLPDGSLLISTEGNLSPGGVTLAADEDIVQFTPTSVGENTAGAFSLFIDGSDIGLGSTDVDGFSMDSQGNLFFSTSGSFSVNGVSGANEDVFAFTPATTGENTSGTFATELVFNGRASGYSQDIRGIDLSFSQI
ncbi:MAG: cadherin-like domain-containing protein [Synechococcales bacterium]|nr:cadherin-like domain-containing protein [Synechococcales bacterium]